MIVFLHGVPETAVIWRKVRDLIDRPSVALSLPGFGCPLPDGFGGTKDDYVAWVVDELGKIDGPIDLVGHDWGAGLTYRVATAHGDLLHSWAADIANVGHPDYVWHDFAQLWQTPGDGEAFIEGQAAAPAEETAAGYEGFGLAPEDALEMAQGYDLVMGQSILGLYRSATPNIHAHWGPWTPTSAPGLVLHPTDDPFGAGEGSAEVAASLGAGYEVIEGAGHFWPYQAPEPFAAALTAFWDSLD